MTADEIDEVKRIVNDRIRQDLEVYDEDIPYKQAVAEGAIALFDEKYGDVVRVLRIGRPPVSAELCGGTHVTTTGEIGFLHIISESSIGAGLRRIEAVTGRGAERYINRRLSDLEKISKYLDTEPDEAVDKAKSLTAELKSERKRAQTLESRLFRNIADSLLNQVKVINGVNVLAASVPPTRMEVLREMSDLLRDKLRSAVVVLGTVHGDKPVFLAAVTPDLVKQGYNAGDIVKHVAKVAGGSGGGRAELAQAGGKNKEKLDEALGQVAKFIKESGSS
jgi:alanyl-tRNA synthetase